MKAIEEESSKRTKARRRRYGEGSIFQRTDGYWAASLELPRGADGKRQRRTVLGKTYTEVKDKLIRDRAAQQDGKLPAAGKLTLGQFLTYWIEEVAPRKVRPSTLTRYRQIVELHLVPHLGQVRLERLTAVDVDRMLRSVTRAPRQPQVQTRPSRSQRRGKPLSPRSIHHLRTVLRTALNVAVRKGLISQNPAAASEPPRVPKVEVAVWTPEQAAAFLEGCRGDRREALYVLALTTGARQGELLGLRWGDVDLGSGRLRIARTLQWVDRAPVLVEPKTATSAREIRLSRLAVEALAQEKRRQEEAREPVWMEADLVFRTPQGLPLRADAVTREFQAVSARLGLPRITFHALRHTAATALLVKGVPVNVVADLLGHSTPTVTMSVYQHVLASLRQGAADTMDELFGRA